MTLSKKRHDFGPCFVLKQPLSKTFLLKVTNNDDSAMSIDCLFEKTDYLNVKLPPGQVLLKQATLDIPIIFTPRQIMGYQEAIEFDINGLHKIKFPIRGEGVPLKLELLKAENKLVDFGIKTVGA
jgi:hydrocephalus-inducing protein